MLLESHILSQTGDLESSKQRIEETLEIVLEQKEGLFHFVEFVLEKCGHHLESEELEQAENLAKIVLKLDSDLVSESDRSSLQVQFGTAYHFLGKSGWVKGDKEKSRDLVMKAIGLQDPISSIYLESILTIIEMTASLSKNPSGEEDKMQHKLSTWLTCVAEHPCAATLNYPISRMVARLVFTSRIPATIKFIRQITSTISESEISKFSTSFIEMVASEMTTQSSLMENSFEQISEILSILRNSSTCEPKNFVPQSSVQILRSIACEACQKNMFRTARSLLNLCIDINESPSVERDLLLKGIDFTYIQEGEHIRVLERSLEIYANEDADVLSLRLAASLALGREKECAELILQLDEVGNPNQERLLAILGEALRCESPQIALLVCVRLADLQAADPTSRNSIQLESILRTRFILSKRCEEPRNVRIKSLSELVSLRCQGENITLSASFLHWLKDFAYNEGVDAAKAKEHGEAAKSFAMAISFLRSVIKLEKSEESSQQEIEGFLVLEASSYLWHLRNLVSGELSNEAILETSNLCKSSIEQYLGSTNTVDPKQSSKRPMIQMIKLECLLAEKMCASTEEKTQEIFSFLSQVKDESANYKCFQVMAVLCNRHSFPEGVIMCLQEIVKRYNAGEPVPESCVAECFREIMVLQNSKISEFCCVENFVTLLTKANNPQDWPADELTWITTRAWNHGAQLYRLRNYKEASKWMSKALQILDCLPSMDAWRERMVESLDLCYEGTTAS
eukprot:GHVP01058791.1.p1 GENE.GHVP01058791.1~~GHVP01058791.1.p1  ORF type:complete len:742 (+),score=138.55 GHVP01058791.1:2049-4274(+)